jgi:hypothetical protein
MSRGAPKGVAVAPNLSKSKVMAYRQCPKRLWLEVHRPELREDSAGAQKLFKAGNRVGEVARRLYDRRGTGSLIDVSAEGYAGALERTKELLSRNGPIFEAGFSAAGVLAFADVLVRRRRAGSPAWHAIEVKSSSKVKPQHEEDLAVQAFAMRKAGLVPGGFAIAHVDTKWTYRGHEDYRGLLKEVDLTAGTKKRMKEVPQWVAGAAGVASARKEPAIGMGAHCAKPYACPFNGHCAESEPKTTYPVAWLPNVRTKALKAFIADARVRDVRQVPDDLLNERQLRVKQQTVLGRPFLDARAAAAVKADFRPARFLDFESVMFAVPIWPGTRPFQQILFQFSLHTVRPDGEVAHEEFLDLSGAEPSRPLAEALIRACGEKGTIYVYSASFEVTRIRELAARYRDLARPLKAILARIKDLRPVAENHYYHPAQQGSWSLKAVAPTVAPELDYDNLDGVADGGAAGEAYMEAIASGTTAARKADIERQLRMYCGRDTEALVLFWRRIKGD